MKNHNSFPEDNQDNTSRRRHGRVAAGVVAAGLAIGALSQQVVEQGGTPPESSEQEVPAMEPTDRIAEGNRLRVYPGMVSIDTTKVHPIDSEYERADDQLSWSDVGVNVSGASSITVENPALTGFHDEHGVRIQFLNDQGEPVTVVIGEPNSITDETQNVDLYQDLIDTEREGYLDFGSYIDVTVDAVEGDHAIASSGDTTLTIADLQ